jgi:hypothetical protein
VSDEAAGERIGVQEAGHKGRRSKKWRRSMKMQKAYWSRRTKGNASSRRGMGWGRSRKMGTTATIMGKACGRWKKSVSAVRRKEKVEERKRKRLRRATRMRGSPVICGGETGSGGAGLGKVGAGSWTRRKRGYTLVHELVEGEFHGM